jgi:hypothetical protein
MKSILTTPRVGEVLAGPNAGRVKQSRPPSWESLLRYPLLCGNSDEEDRGATQRHQQRPEMGAHGKPSCDATNDQIVTDAGWASVFDPVMMSLRAPCLRRLLAASVLVGAAACGGRAPEAARRAPAPAVSAAPAALRAYRDPSTGAFVEPAPGLASPQMPATAPAALVEEAAPRGGRMIRLHGAFRSHVGARVGAEGAGTVSCGTGAETP